MRSPHLPHLRAASAPSPGKALETLIRVRAVLSPSRQMPCFVWTNLMSDKSRPQIFPQEIFSVNLSGPL